MRHKPADKFARGSELFAQPHHVVARAVGYATTIGTAAGVGDNVAAHVPRAPSGQP
ncbi:hypothetical protein PF003_g20754 [Phytophthora fragariae]|nr:hypothetical protein PF003_g20754 [Phytophthora fragariae]